MACQINAAIVTALVYASSVAFATADEKQLCRQVITSTSNTSPCSQNEQVMGMSGRNQPTAFGPKENGFCVKADGDDQNDGVHKVPADTAESCKQYCMLQLQYAATACEFVDSRKSNGGCYIHTQAVAHGNGKAESWCWVNKHMAQTKIMTVFCCVPYVPSLPLQNAAVNDVPTAQQIYLGHLSSMIAGVLLTLASLTLANKVRSRTTLPESYTVEKAALQSHTERQDIWADLPVTIPEEENPNQRQKVVMKANAVQRKAPADMMFYESEYVENRHTVQVQQEKMQAKLFSELGVPSPRTVTTAGDGWSQCSSRIVSRAGSEVSDYDYQAAVLRPGTSTGASVSRTVQRISAQPTSVSCQRSTMTHRRILSANGPSASTLHTAGRVSRTAQVISAPTASGSYQRSTASDGVSRTHRPAFQWFQ